MDAEEQFALLEKGILLKEDPMRRDDTGWLKIGDTFSNEVYDLTEGEIEELLALAEEDDAWTQRVKAEAKYYDKHPGNFLLDYFRVLNLGGTVTGCPYGDMITFPSRRHLFRGEPQQYAHSLPSLNRAIKRRNLSLQDAELYRAVAYMRVWQFRKFVWQFDIVPYWEAKLSDVNYMALAQHYGFETSLLDITNDARVALFFATCQYDWDTDSYRPLTQKDIDREPTADANPRFGMIFHSPDWVTDYLAPMGSIGFGMRNPDVFTRAVPYPLSSSALDGTSFQIGYQPFYRCQYQRGYIYPMRENQPMQQNDHFEKLRFRQSVTLSKRIYDMMDGGKKIFPQEGIAEALPILQRIQSTVVFSHDDVQSVYEFEEVDKNFFPTLQAYEEALNGFSIDGKRITIQASDVLYPIPRAMKRRINRQYNKTDLGKMIGEIHMTQDQRRHREKRCLEIYGELI